MTRVRKHWPFGIDLCCLSSENDALLPGAAPAKKGSGHRLAFPLPSAALPPPRAAAASRPASAARRSSRRRLGDTVGPTTTTKAPYSLMHFFNKPFRSTICAANASGFHKQKVRFYLKARAYHEDVVRSLRDDAGASDLALVPPTLQRATCMAHSSAEEACARAYLLSFDNPSLAAQAALPLDRFYAWLTPFKSCRLGARLHADGPKPYCPEDAVLQAAMRRRSAAAPRR